MTHQNTEALLRFTEAQQRSYEIALQEIKRGRKSSHWMWYIFPQVRGLGSSDTAKFYAIRDLSEAKTFLEHTVLGPRLVAISRELLNIPDSDAVQVFGETDSMKLRSSMTLFSLVSGADPVFAAVLEKFFGGKKDEATIRLVEGTFRGKNWFLGDNWINVQL